MSDDPDFKALDASIKHYREKESADGWTKYVSLSMIFLAVLAAFASQRSAVLSSTVIKELNEATFNQAEASDQWSYYQAKGIKQALAEANHLDAKAARYASEMQDVMKDARALEAKRDQARSLAETASEKSQRMSVDSTIFQAAIAVGGVCLTVKKRWAWFVSLALGLVGVILMAWLVAA